MTVVDLRRENSLLTILFDVVFSFALSSSYLAQEIYTKICPYLRAEKIDESREMRRREIVNGPSSVRKNQFKLIFSPPFFYINVPNDTAE